MNKTRLLAVIILASILLLAPKASALTAEEIIERVDNNHYVEQARMESELVIKTDRKEMTKELIIYLAGNSALVEFTNATDKGTKYLMIEDDLWISFPDVDDPVRISNRMLEQGMAGSDFSYQDLMEQEQLLELYDFEIIDHQEYQGRASYLIEGVTKDGVNNSYYRRKLWVDQERFVYLKEELYSREGRLLRTIEAEEVEQFGKRWYVTESLIDYKLRSGSKTLFRVTGIDFEPDISEEIFSLQGLK
ncbi:outer membrane lipoprotein-sorting protein [Natroniella sulfidigena]|uniref:outer membrane lipoprotein-sorting protein n=1 Tax=Natroniella sulfidigena TaxID=723921 RepID=UPI00200B3DD5|nr:outer membrane lipoprotein-sorting protein [Natroniella sulfidigena]MCK8817850.1 outer membrane lipoprotein-sorting protein [Natroniella sulfidigena]